MRDRYYNPVEGRFLSEDPVWSTNLFPYAENNPINRIDPKGTYSLYAPVGIGESLIPFWGSFRQANYYASQGNYWLAGLNAAFAVSDLIGVGEAIDLGKDAILSAKAISNAQKVGFKSFSAFKSEFGKAGEGMAWHHIIEQTPSNVSKFGAEAIHTESNLVKVEHGAGSIHSKISAYYSSKKNFTNGETVRKWLSNQSYKKQYDFGVKILKKLSK